MRPRRAGGNALLTCARGHIALAAALTGALIALAAISPALATADNPIAFSSAQSIESGRANLTLSCPSITLCVAGDSNGYILSSTAPATPSTVWGAVEISPAASSIEGVSCPNASFCVAVTQAGDAYTSTSPASTNPASWTEQPNVAAGSSLAAVSCPSASVCVAVGNDGAYISTNAGASWPAVSSLASAPGFANVACPTIDLCVLVGEHETATLTNLAAGAAATATPNVTADLANQLTAVACLTSSLCVDVDNAAPHANALFSMDLATADWGAPAPTDSAGAINAITCPLSSLCVAVDSGGDANFLSYSPGDPAAWTVQSGFDPTGAGLTAVSCPQSGFCVALDQGGGAALGTGAQLNVALAGAGGGTISDSESYLSCGLQCSAYYAGGTSVTLTATAGAGSIFAGWTGGGCSGIAPVCTLTNGAAGSTQTVTAKFTPPPPHTTITKAKIHPKSRSARFTFKATESATKFQCALVHNPARRTHRGPSFHSCRSAKNYQRLKGGGYEFFVRGIGPGGTDPDPASTMFRIP
jgi:hypothetical protein